MPVFVSGYCAAIRAVIASNSARACSIETPFLHLADAIEKEIAARIVFLLELKRHPDVADFREPPAFRHDADRRDLFAVDRNDFADDAAIAAEMFLPDLVADQRDRRRVQLVFLGTKQAAEDRLHAEEGKRIGGDLPAKVTLRFVAARNDEGRLLDGANAFQGGDILFPIEVIGKRRPGVVVRQFLVKNSEIATRRSWSCDVAASAAEEAR